MSKYAKAIKNRLQKLTKIQKIGIIAGAFLIFSILFALLDKKVPSFPFLPRPVAHPTPFAHQSTTKIGEDLFSKTDFDYLLGFYLPEKQSTPLTTENINELEEIAFERSVVIQEAKERGLIEVNEEIFNPNKNWTEYNETYEKAKEAIISQEEQISVAGVFIYFQNLVVPEMGLAEAKAFTREKIERLETQLNSGAITLRQAAQTIKTDASLAQIDPMYRQNAYADFMNRNKSRQIIDGLSLEDNELLWSLNVSEYSPIVLGYEVGNSSSSNEAYWAMFQILEKKGTEKPYLEWLEEMKGKYEEPQF